MPPEAVDEFFFDAVAVNAVTKIAWAKRICQGCPVVDECRDFGLELDPPYGLFGGLGPKDRQRHKLMQHGGDIA